jgi:hypothetical protein
VAYVRTAERPDVEVKADIADSSHIGKDGPTTAFDRADAPRLDSRTATAGDR